MRWSSGWRGSAAGCGRSEGCRETVGHHSRCRRAGYGASLGRGGGAEVAYNQEVAQVNDRVSRMAAWMQEVVGFPELKHDDRCDALSMALQRLRGYVEPYCAVVPSGEAPGAGEEGGSG